MRIGITADTHCRARDGGDLPPAFLDALAGVDLIIHLGDVGAPGTLDRLERIAPVEAVRGRADRGKDPRLRDHARAIGAEELRLGLASHLQRGRLTRKLTAAFGGAVDVVLFGGTHRDCVALRDGVLFVNPGSPTLPDGGAPTLARLDVDEREARVEIVRLPAP